MNIEYSLKKKLIYNLKILFKIIIGHNYYLYKSIYQIKGNKEELLFSRKTDLVIEGFPRVGNTFFVLAFGQLCEEKLKISHHVHLTCQIREGLKHNVPVVVLIRDPLDSVLSLKIREPRIFINTAFVWYYLFYSYALYKKNNIYIKSFKSYTSDYKNITIPEFKFKDIKNIKLENIFERIDKINKEDNKTESRDKFSISSPNEEKQKLKECIRMKIRNNSFLVKICNKLYNDLTT